MADTRQRVNARVVFTRACTNSPVGHHPDKQSLHDAESGIAQAGCAWTRTLRELSSTIHTYCHGGFMPALEEQVPKATSDRCLCENTEVEYTTAAIDVQGHARQVWTGCEGGRSVLCPEFP